MGSEMCIRDSQQIAQADLVLEQRTAIDQALNAVPTLRLELSDAEASVESARTKASEATGARNELHQVDRTLGELVSAGERARRHKTELANRCALTDEVPCQGTDMQGRCKLLTEALEAKTGLPEAEQELEAKGEEYRQLKTQRDELAAKVEGLASAEKTLCDAQAELGKARTELDNAERLAARAGELEQAQQNRSRAQEDLAQAQSLLEAKEAETQAAHSEFATRRNTLNDRKNAALEKHTSAQKALEEELARIPVPGDQSALEAARARLKANENYEQQAREKLDSARGSIAHSQGQLFLLYTSQIPRDS